ncbi:MAG TPA: hypothetical protein DEP91_03110 [Sphingomonas bacterium]|jgi:hypothetical protein|uniref:Uncharacterized protein n=1 Tax=Sphingomonas bacterium TaxID=1895847 RepID=A0A3D0W902_9SPHN|nr:hypothetical protein [Sphingomonas bacterium]
MSIITKDTATGIALAYREIEAAEKLRADVTAAIDRFSGQDLRDVFGRRVDGLTLGVPSGDNARQCFTLPHSVALPVIDAHIAHCRDKIVALTETAKAEIAGALQ